MLVDWNPVAQAALRSFLDFISDRNAMAAQELYDAIATAVEALPQHPYLHRPGRVPGTREKVVHPNYIVVYRVATAIETLNVLHARQQYPPGLRVTGYPGDRCGSLPLMVKRAPGSSNLVFPGL